VRLIQLSDVGVGKFLDKSSKVHLTSDAETLKVFYLKKDDVLISRIG